jgi:hypothetical protein
VNARRHLLQQSSRKLFVGREVFEVNGDQNLLSLGIDITDVDTTFVSEENPVTLSFISVCFRSNLECGTYLSHRVDVNVVFGVLGVRNKWLDQELAEEALDVLDLLLLASAFCDPSTSIGPALVEGEQTALASTLDQLIWLSDKFGVFGEQPRVCGLGLVEDSIDVGILREVEGSEFGRRVVSSSARKRGGLDDRRASEVVVEDGLSIGLENRFGGHCVVGDVFCVTMSRNFNQLIERNKNQLCDS